MMDGFPFEFFSRELRLEPPLVFPTNDTSIRICKAIGCLPPLSCILVAPSWCLTKLSWPKSNLIDDDDSNRSSFFKRCHWSKTRSCKGWRSNKSERRNQSIITSIPSYRILSHTLSISTSSEPSRP